ncbi:MULTISPECIES: polysaccharide biosynthesis/export family protein [unclassified Dysgonomonas]|uniref:polysaccharide biosynthesis/export family protein n=1 Tax=unclassified Dysgonomonas TaxID=2630389 RepID=UPI0013EB5906|nr:MULTISPECIES: polysaccharide biosynthesis/export family protein [unclassified Dysgonomonas]
MKSKIKIFLIGICILCISNSCVTNRQTDLLQEIEKSYPNASPEEYKIIPGDLLTITVYSMDKEAGELFAGYTPNFTWINNVDNTAQGAGQIRGQENTWQIRPIPVYADGNITFPYIGKVHMEGLTILEARNVISAKLDEFAEGTSADVNLSNRYFSVLGEAGARRITMNTTQMTIYQALALSGTISPYGDRTKVSILRQANGSSILKTFDLRSEDIVNTDFYYIQPNDVIYIPQGKRKFLGASTSFVGFVGLLTSVAGVIIFALRVI